MNLIYIDTATGDFGIMKSRKSIQIATGGKKRVVTRISKNFPNGRKIIEVTGGLLKANKLVAHFWGNRLRKKTGVMSYTDNRYIVLPAKEINKVYTDPKLIEFFKPK